MAPQYLLCSINNFCLLVTKYYIYKQQLFEENKIVFYEYLITLKYNQKMEHAQHCCMV